MENLAKMAEAKYACLYLVKKIHNSKTRNAALLEARKVFQKEFKEKLGIKYYVPDPKGSLKNMQYYGLIKESVYFETIPYEATLNFLP